MPKKILFPILIFFLLTAVFGQVSAATVFYFSPATIKVKEGETFALKIKIDPQGIKNYTIKTDIKFPADLVSIKTWKFGDNWMPLRKTDYDYFNNTTGALIRTAGYPEGFSGKTDFGTATFVAKKSGEAVIEFTAQSLAFDEDSNNIYQSGKGAVITIEAGTPVLEPITPEIVNPPENIPEQLFDINLELDRTKMEKIGDLNARVTIISFGRAPTPTDLTFEILDSSGRVVRTEKDTITVETEKVYNKKFIGFDLAPGSYTLRLTTLYNENVRDEFKQPFEIIKPGGLIGQYLTWLIIGGAGLIIAVIVLIIIFKKKAENEKYYR